MKNKLKEIRIRTHKRNSNAWEIQLFRFDKKKHTVVDFVFVKFKRYFRTSVKETQNVRLNSL